MARVEAPLMSLNASGSIGGALVFSRWRGRKYVRSLVTPANPKSPTQVGIRSMMRYLAQAWAGTYFPTSANWDDLAEATNISNFNAFIAFNMRNWRDGFGPADDPATLRDSTPGTAPLMDGVPAERIVTLEISPAANANRLALAIFRALADGGPATYANCIAVIPIGVGADAVYYVDGPLPPDTYYYSARDINDDGALGADLTPNWASATISP